MDPRYTITDTSSLLSPSLIFFKDLIEHNIHHAIEMVGNPQRLRPHVKTHKTREIVQMQMALGITRHKCATIAEAEMLARCEAPDIFLAYNLVGPNCGRMAQLVRQYPESHFITQVDHPTGATALSHVMQESGQQVEVLLDLNVGQDRTGIAIGKDAIELYQRVQDLPGLKPGGLHVYDGHHHQESPEERGAAVRSVMDQVAVFRQELEDQGLPVPRIVGGGAPTFPIFATLDIPGLECSPGTCFLHDNGYGSRFPDLKGFLPAALLLTRVISKPTADRLTLDLGYKAVASDPPADNRCALMDIRDYKAVLQNEEHLVITTPHAAQYNPGDVVYAIPTHICPTSAMHQKAYVVENQQVQEEWEIAARNRCLTI